jgi:hypothetical protein
LALVAGAPPAPEPSLLQAASKTASRSGREYFVGPGLERRAIVNLESLAWERGFELLSQLYPELHFTERADGSLLVVDGSRGGSPKTHSESAGDILRLIPVQRLKPADILDATQLLLGQFGRVDLGSKGALLFRGSAGGYARALALVKQLDVRSGDSVPVWSEPEADAAAAPVWVPGPDAWCPKPNKLAQDVSLNTSESELALVIKTVLESSGQPYVISPNIRSLVAVKKRGPWDCVAKELARTTRISFRQTSDGVIVARGAEDEFGGPAAPPLLRKVFVVPTKDVDDFMRMAKLAASAKGAVAIIRPLGWLLVKDEADVIERLGALLGEQQLR